MDTIDRIKVHEQSLAGLEAEHARLSRDLEKAGGDRDRLQAESRDTEAARDIINEVLKATQEEVVGLVSEMVSLALGSVYGPDHSFRLDFEVRRNQSEATPWIVRGGHEFSPREEVGGGVLDICALALRLSLWALKTPRTAPVFILDEPGKWLSADRQEAFGRMLKEVGDMLGVQWIIVSHSEGIIGQADKAWEVILENGVSKVSEIQRE